MATTQATGAPRRSVSQRPGVVKCSLGARRAVELAVELSAELAAELAVELADELAGELAADPRTS